MNKTRFLSIKPDFILELVKPQTTHTPAAAATTAKAKLNAKP